LSDIEAPGAPFSSLSMLARLRRSRRAGMLGRGMAVAAGWAAAAGAYFALAGSPLAWAAAPAVGLTLALGAIAVQQRRGSAYRAIAVDAGGNWMLADDSGWRRLRPRRIWRSPLGWLTLQGDLAPPPGRLHRPVRATVTVWSDSLDARDWRLLRIAAAWTEQRGEGLLVSPQARDPRLGNPA